MKTILCFGDSNTHGTSPLDWSRFDIDTRWPGVLRNELGDDYWIIEEGCGGRTTVHDDPIEEAFGGGGKNGATYLRPCLHSHGPIDLVCILLGTNDLKARFNVGADDIARGAGVLVEICHRSTAGPGGRPPMVLLMCPPPTTSLAHTPFREMIAGGEAKSKQLAGHYRSVAQEKGCAFFDCGEHIVSSMSDGLHWDAGEHAKLGKAVAMKVQQLIG